MKKILSIILSLFLTCSFFGCSEKNDNIQKATTNENNVSKFNEKDYNRYFNGIDGCAIFYSVKSDTYDVYNKNMVDVEEIPCSSFKIISAIAGLETGFIENSDTVLEWDGSKYMMEDWEQDLSLDKAFKLSANWYFDKIDKTVGQEVLKDIVEKTDYGNKDISGGIPNGEAKLKISPREQADFIRALFNNKFGFKENTLDNVKKIMSAEIETGELYGKTGTSGTEFLPDGNQTAWFVGLYKENENEYYFAVRIWGDKDNENIRGPVAQEIAKNICLNEYCENQ